MTRIFTYLFTQQKDTQMQINLRALFVYSYSIRPFYSKFDSRTLIILLYYVCTRSLRIEFEQVEVRL